VSLAFTRKQPAAVLRVRQVVPQRGIVRVVLDLRGQFLNQIRQAVRVLGLVRIQDLGLQIAALRPDAGGGQQQQA
jgi:hypothetical protein